MPTADRHRSLIATTLVLALAGAVLTAAILKGAFIAGGADSFGYVSQADLWSRAQLRIHEPLVHEVPWPSADWTLSPLGYRPAYERNGDIVPAYPPGYPLVMAAFELAGGRQAKFFVVPLMGGLTVWLTYVFGRRLAGPLPGVLAAIWLASSPTFLYTLMTPMSDVPATVWWLLAVLLLTYATRGTALAAGLAASVAILTRPNLVILAAVLGLFLGLEVVRDRAPGKPSVLRLMLFAAGVVPGCVTVGLLFNYWYGSPFQSGYEPLRYLYAWSHAQTNVPNCSRWMLETLTPLGALALASPWVLGRVPARAQLERERLVPLSWSCLAFFVVVFVTYVFYLPFDAWWYVRFLLPAYPLLVVLSAAVVTEALARVRSGTRIVLVSSLCLGLMGWGVTMAVRRSAFDFSDGELKYVRMAHYVDTRLPQRSVVLAMQHSGSIRYYSGRLTLRYDRFMPTWLDRALAYLHQQGRSPYIVLEDWEEPVFRQKFAEQSPAGRLDWPPAAELQTAGGGHVRLYVPGDRLRFLRGEPIVTEHIQ